MEDESCDLCGVAGGDLDVAQDRPWPRHKKVFIFMFICRNMLENNRHDVIEPVLAWSQIKPFSKMVSRFHTKKTIKSTFRFPDCSATSNVASVQFGLIPPMIYVPTAVGLLF